MGFAMVGLRKREDWEYSGKSPEMRDLTVLGVIRIVGKFRKPRGSARRRVDSRDSVFMLAAKSFRSGWPPGSFSQTWKSGANRWRFAKSSTSRNLLNDSRLSVTAN